MAARVHGITEPDLTEHVLAGSAYEVILKISFNSPLWIGGRWWAEHEGESLWPVWQWTMEKERPSVWRPRKKLE